MWAVHMNHHSSEEMNFTVALRQAWFGPITKVPFFFILPIIGFDPFITALAGVAATMWGVTGHTQVIKTLGPLEYIFVTPSSHRVHHGSNPEYIDKNYGNMFIIWDRLFGTFAKEDSKVIFGITNNVKTFNPVKITFMNWLQIVKDFSNSSNFNEKLNLLGLGSQLPLSSLYSSGHCLLVFPFILKYIVLNILPSFFSSPNSSNSYFFESSKAPLIITKGPFDLFEFL